MLTHFWATVREITVLKNSRSTRFLMIRPFSCYMSLPFQPNFIINPLWETSWMPQSSVSCSTGRNRYHRILLVNFRRWRISIKWKIWYLLRNTSRKNTLMPCTRVRVSVGINSGGFFRHQIPTWHIFTDTRLPKVNGWSMYLSRLVVWKGLYM